MKHPSNKSRERRQVSRRRFLQAAAAVAGVAGTGRLPLARSAHAAGSNILKIGLIGCGSRGCGAAVNAMSADRSVRLVAMADLFADRLEAGRKNIQRVMPDQMAVDDEHCFVGFDGYQHVIASDATLVLIACASSFHSAYLKAAVDAGKHVFVEKPCAIDPPGCRTVLMACNEARKKKLSVVAGLMSRYNKAHRETIQRVWDGAIGEITAVHSCFLRGPYRLVKRSPKESEIEYQYRNWYHFNWLSGDDILQSLIHNLDRVAWVLHEKTPLTAYGLGGRSSSFEPVFGTTFDHHSVVYQYADGLRVLAMCRAQAGCYGEVSDTIFGTKGRCELHRHRIIGEKNWSYQGDPCNAYEQEQRELIASIRNGEPINNGPTMTQSTLSCVAGQIACYTGQEVDREQLSRSDFAFSEQQHGFDRTPPVTPMANGQYPIAIPGITRLL